MAVTSPYELVFGSALFEEGEFPEIQEEAGARGVETSSPERFLHLGSVGLLLQRLLPEGSGSEEFRRYGQLLYHAYHYWLYGKNHYQLSESETRELVTSSSAAERWSLAPPAPAGFLELPRHLFWARIEEDATPEPVAGFFWTVAGPGGPTGPAAPADRGDPTGGADPSRRLEILLVLGLFPGRPGFSTIAIDSAIERTDRFPRSGGRPEGEDFANILPGGELQGWYGLVTELEVLKLVSLTFAALAEGESDER